MKGRWYRLLTYLVMVVVLVPAVRAGAVPTLFIDPALTQVRTGGDCWVDVRVNDEVLGLTGYDLVIDYDETVVELIDVVEGALPQSAGPSFFYWTEGPPPESALVINGAVLGDSVDGPGVLARLLFRGLVPGASPVYFLDYELRDIENVTIPVMSVGGTIEVSDPPTIFITPSISDVDTGEYFSIDIEINETLTGLTGYNLRISMNPAIVEIIGAIEGWLPPTGGPTFFDWLIEAPGTILIDGAVLGGWVDGPGVLATVNLFAVSVGTTDVDFITVDLRDIDNHPLEATDEGAVIIVRQPPVAVENTSWSELKALFR